MVDGKWFTASEYQKFLADAAAERERRIAEQKAAEEKLIAEQRAAEEKRIAEQKALEKKRAEEEQAKERERERKEQKAATDLNRANKEFEAAEKRAAESYQSAAKGGLSGQVFVSTMGGQSIKLGAVRVSLFAREAVNILLAGLKAYSGAQIELLRESSDAGKATMEDFSTVRDESYYSSGDFYFSYLRSPLQTAETDADGKFVIEVPRSGSFVIAARGQRSLWDNTEKYYWLQPVSLEGQQQRVQNFSNNNLTSTTGTSSLILTKD